MCPQYLQAGSGAFRSLVDASEVEQWTHLADAVLLYQICSLKVALCSCAVAGASHVVPAPEEASCGIRGLMVFLFVPVLHSMHVAGSFLDDPFVQAGDFHFGLGQTWFPVGIFLVFLLCDLHQALRHQRGLQHRSHPPPH